MLMGSQGQEGRHWDEEEFLVALLTRELHVSGKEIYVLTYYPVAGLISFLHDIFVEEMLTCPWTE